jgi:hypothetical protein
MQPGIEGEGKDPVSVEATLVRIRRWHKRRAQEDPDATVVKGRVAQKIEAYLGPAATDRILQPVNEHAKLVPAVEPVLTIFLGCRAAGRLIDHIIDSAIVRI